MILGPHIPTKFALVGYPDGSANINLGVETFIPLRVRQIVLLE
jgi:hypothetical protein